MARTQKRIFGNTSESFSSFSLLAKQFAGLALAGGLAFGGYEAVQARRAALWEQDLSTLARKVQGADDIAEHELAVLDRRSESAERALASLTGLEQPMEFLVGKKVPDLAARVESMIMDDRLSINKAVRLAMGIAKAEEVRAAGGSSSEFIHWAKVALEGEAVEAAWSGAPFNGTEGFATKNLAQIEAAIGADRQEAITRLAKAKARVAELAPGFGEEQARYMVDGMTRLAGADALLAAKAEAAAKMDTYLAQVKSAAAEAYRKEGESMSEGDWEETVQGLQRDPEWLGAKKGLVDAAVMTAKQAEANAADAWGEEAVHAQALAQAIAEDPSRVDEMTVWETAMLLHWMDTDAGSSRMVASQPMRMASQGYALSGAPRAGLDGMGAYKMASGVSVSVRPSYAGSRVVTDVVRAQSAGDGARGSPSLGGLAMQAAAARASLSTASGAVAAGKDASSKPLSSYGFAGSTSAVGRAASGAASSASNRAALGAASAAASRAASGAASAAASRAASSAASAAASRAASSAASAASSRAATSAAASSGRR